MITITRKLEFDAGHRVLGHEGKCKHLHGHRYVAEVTVGYDLGLDTLGRVVDFGVVKVKVGGWIDRHWDHNMLLRCDDPLWDAGSKILTRTPYRFESNPTAENMAKKLFEVAGNLLTDLTVIRIRIWETPNCWADYDGE